jgi:hypothetical protein
MEKLFKNIKLSLVIWALIFLQNLFLGHDLLSSQIINSSSPSPSSLNPISINLDQLFMKINRGEITTKNCKQKTGLTLKEMVTKNILQLKKMTINKNPFKIFNENRLNYEPFVYRGMTLTLDELNKIKSEGIWASAFWLEEKNQSHQIITDLLQHRISSKGSLFIPTTPNYEVAKLFARGNSEDEKSFNIVFKIKVPKQPVFLNCNIQFLLQKLNPPLPHENEISFFGHIDRSWIDGIFLEISESMCFGLFQNKDWEYQKWL